MAATKMVTPGYKVIYPNREEVTSQRARVAVVLTLLLSVLLMLIISVGGWSKLEGMQAVNLIWCLIYLVLAFYVARRWARGLLPIAAALGILLLVIAAVAGLGVAGTSWFDRDSFGFASAQLPFGGTGLDADTLGILTLLLLPLQALLIVVSLIAFSQRWNVETEVPVAGDRAVRRVGVEPTSP